MTQRRFRSMLMASRFPVTHLYVAVALASSTVALFARQGGNYIRLANVGASGASNSVLAVDITPDGVYMAISYAGAPGVVLFKLDKLGRATQLGTVPATNSGQVYSLRWSADGTILACSGLTTPFMTLYKRTGDTLALLPTPTSPVTSDCRAVAWGKSAVDGEYVSFCCNSSPWIHTWKRNSDDTFTKLPDVTTSLALPATAPGPYAIRWSPDGVYLAVVWSNGGNNNYGWRIVKRTGTTQAQLGTLPTLDGRPAQFASTVDWSPDGRCVAIASETLLKPQVYEHTGDTFTKVADAKIVGSQPGGALRTLRYTPDGKALVVQATTTPFSYVYLRPDIVNDPTQHVYTAQNGPVQLGIGGGAIACAILGK